MIGKYECDKKLGAGCFGEVWRAVDSYNRKDCVAVKFESQDSEHPQLEHEATLLSYLQQQKKTQGFPDYHFFVREGDYNALVMQPLNKNLEDRKRHCGGKFSVRTTVLIAEQLLVRIAYLHSKGIIHRDIKPENFMFGNAREGKQHHLYMVDFGLSMRYYDRQHVPMKRKDKPGKVTGTARYASINCHKGCQQSRRDDLEAAGYMLVYFLKGELPWQGLQIDDEKEKLQKILEMKESIPLSEFCEGIPDVFE